MNKMIIPSLIAIAAVLSGCGDDSVSCSNPTVTKMVIDLSKNYLAGQANQTMNPVLLFMAQGVMDLQAIRTNEKTNNVLSCEASLHIIVDPKIVKASNGDLKAEPVLTVNYSTQETDDHKGYYVKIFSLE